MEPRKAFLASPFSLLLIFVLTISLYGGKVSSNEHRVTPHEGPVVEKGQRRTLTVTEYGEISAIDVKDGHRAPYHLQFITLEPNSVFLPVLLHADMVFYVETGSGRLIWADEGDTSRIDLRQGDICRLREGSIFYIQSNLEAERKKLRIYAMFANTDDNTYDPSIGAYSRINELVRGFDKKIMQAAFKVPEDLIEAITNKTNTPTIVHAVSKEQNTFWEMEASFLKNFLGMPSNGKKVKTYNIFNKDPDFKNCNGWSLTVTQKQFKSLKGTDIGFLMVNLTMRSMLGPHWNPRATEIAVVLQGEGMVRVVCGSSNFDKAECQNMRFKVKQGDLFIVPRYHPMAQMSFSNDSLVFLGFSTAAKKNYPQFLAGKRSVLQTLDKQILATSFDVSNTTIDQVFTSQDDSIIFGCSSCAEEEERIMKEEREKKKEEEAKRREEEEAREREEKKRREEEEAREREEKKRREREEKKRREEEEARGREKKKKREEEEARRREEEEARREEEKEEEEEARRREEEEARREEEKEEEEEEEEAEREQEQARRQHEERQRKREEEQARTEEKRRREEEAQREQEQARRQQERKREEEAQREQEQARKQHEKKERRRQEEEARREQEQAEREQEKAERRREEEEAEREHEQAGRQQKEREKKREEEEARREKERGREEEVERESEEGKRRQKRREKGRSREEEEEEAAAAWEQEQARRQQEERERKREEERRREREVDDESMDREVDGQSYRSRFEGRRVLKIRNV